MTPAQQIGLWMLIGAPTIGAIFFVIRVLRSRKEKTVVHESVDGLPPVTADEKPPIEVSQWLSRYILAAPDAPSEAIVAWVLGGKTLMEVVTADRERIKKAGSAS